MGNQLGKAIENSILGQEGKVLRRGQPPREGYDTLRQREIWSTFHLTNGQGLAINTSALTGNVPVLQAGTYDLFVTDAGAAGQGLPDGLQMTPLDTNFVGAGRMPDQQNLAVWEIGVSVLEQRSDVVELSPTTRGAGQPDPDDVDKILTEGVLVWKALTQTVPYGHLSDYVSAGGPSIVVPSVLDYTATGAVAAGPPAGGVGGMGAGDVTAQPWALQVPKLQTNGGGGNAAPGARTKLDVPIFLPSKTQWKVQLVFKRPVVLRSLENGGTAGFRVRVDLWCAESYRTSS